MGRIRAVLVGSVVLAVLATTGATVVQGQSPEGHAIRAPEHLAVRVLTQAELDARIEPEVRSFDTFAAAMAFASGGSIDINESLDGSASKSQLLANRGAVSARSSQTVIGVDYNWSNFNSGGGTLTWWAPNSAGCSGGATFFAPEMPGGWDKIVSSAIAMGGCNTWIHFSAPSYGGADYRCTCPIMDDMNNQTQSETWRS